MKEINIQPDNFASSHFGVKIGKISPENFTLSVGEIKDALLQAQQGGFEVLTTRLPSDQIPEIEKAEEIGGQVFDVLITSTMFPTRPVEKFSPSKNIYIVESYDKLTDQDDINAVGEIGATAFDLTHFYTDPRLSKDGWKSFYRQWSINDVTNRARQTIVARDVFGGQTIGFNALLAYENEQTPYGNKTLGIVDLVAVDKRYRGLGIGKALVSSSIDWFSKNVEAATVGTQKDNPAAFLYQECGFVEYKCEDTYHLWLDSLPK